MRPSGDALESAADLAALEAGFGPSQRATGDDHHPHDRAGEPGRATRGATTTVPASRPAPALACAAAALADAGNFKALNNQAHASSVTTEPPDPGFKPAFALQAQTTQQVVNVPDATQLASGATLGGDSGEQRRRLTWEYLAGGLVLFMLAMHAPLSGSARSIMRPPSSRSMFPSRRIRAPRRTKASIPSDLGPQQYRDRTRKVRVMDLVLDVSESGDHLAVPAPGGEVDVSTAPKLRQQLVELATEGRPWVVVDLSEVTFLDSTGLGVLVGGLRRFRLLGGDLILAAAQPADTPCARDHALDRAFDLFASVGAAVTAGIGR